MRYADRRAVAPGRKEEAAFMKAFYLASALSIFFATACLADEPIVVSGCPVPGVEGGCILLKTANGVGYNISAAKPTPTFGTYGQIKGILKSRAVSTCMQGQIISPAAWTQTGQRCPF
jgi:hypothetical protein